RLVPPADLTVLSATIPAVVAPIMPFDVPYTVKNLGNASAVAFGWSDAVYFSTDQTLDFSDPQLTQAFHSNFSPLAPNGTYDQTLTGVSLPASTSNGSYYLLIATDSFRFEP